MVLPALLTRLTLALGFGFRRPGRLLSGCGRMLPCNLVEFRYGELVGGTR